LSWHNSPYSLNCHTEALWWCSQLCRTASSSRVHKTESVSAMGHARRSAAVSSTGWTRNSSLWCGNPTDSQFG